MYLSHFGLNEPPFRITPHTDFFFEGANRGATLGALLYAISHEEGIIKITGEVGSGKTMLCRVLIERLPVNVETIYLANPSLSRDEILYTIADDLRVSIEGRRTSVLLRALQEDLIKRYAAGKRVVVLIDEAHAMPLETLEEIRLLSNLESNRHKLLHIVLFGQPELDDHLALPNMRQIRERIIHSFKLEPLVREDITQYIEFRMRAAGYKGPSVFSAGALKTIAQTSQGLTRRVNILADKALLAAFADGTHQVTVKHARAAVRDSEFKRAARGRSMWAIAATGVAAGLLVGLFFHFYTAQRSAPVTGAVGAAVSPPEATPRREPPNPPAVTAQLPTQAEPVGEQAPTPKVTEATPAPSSVEPAAPIAPASAKPAEPPAAPPAAPSASAPTPAAPAPAAAPERPAPQPAPSDQQPAPTQVASAAPSPIDESTPTTSVVPPEGQLARARFAATQDWLKNAPAKTYSIELLTVRGSNSEVLEDFVRQLGQLLDPDAVHVYSVKIDGTQYYAVAYGNYPSVADTVTAMGQLPETLKARAPYPRSFGRMRYQNQQ
jgi:MSHA biogenesis protein MshM